VDANNIPENRDRLVVIEERLARLRAQYDLLMSAFKFDEAREVFARIEAATGERDGLAKALPVLPPAPPPASVETIRPRSRHFRRRR
jgi:hypothetical protein